MVFTSLHCFKKKECTRHWETLEDGDLRHAFNNILIVECQLGADGLKGIVSVIHEDVKRCLQQLIVSSHGGD